MPTGLAVQLLNRSDITTKKLNKNYLNNILVYLLWCSQICLKNHNKSQIFLEKPWKTLKNLISNPLKILEQPWISFEKPWKNNEKAWKSVENPLKNIEKPWTSLKILWKSFEKPWKSVENHWKTMKKTITNQWKNQ